MAMPSFAFSIHNFISSVGADAGFAAIIGLAVLVLLYFAHARETANLREDAALLTQRLHQAEARVIELSRMQAVARSQEVLEAEPVAAEAVAIGRFAPAGMGAPALLSATRMVPAAAPVGEAADAAPDPAVTPVPAMAMAGVGAPATISAAQAPPSPRPPMPAPGSPSPGSPAGALPSPAPASPAGASPAPASPAVPAPSTNAGGNGHAAGPSPAVPVPSSRAASGGGSYSSRSFPPLELPRTKRRSRFRRGMAAAVVALVVVLGAVVLFTATSIGGSPGSSPPTSTTNASSGKKGAAAFKPSSVTVAVLNGTAVNQLAHRIAVRLAALGYKQGTVATASNQTESTTLVAYLAGAKNRVDALHVAKSLGLRRAAVRPVDQGTLQVACPTPSACPANVVVTVGADLASP